MKIMWTNIWFLALVPCAAWAIMTVPANDASIPLTDLLTNLVGKLKPVEEKRQMEFERWCNGSLTAQAHRRDDLQRLLSQAMPLTELGERLPQLSHDIPALQAQLAKEKTAIQAVEGALRTNVRDAELALQDEKKEYDALQKMQNWLNKKKNLPGGTRQLEKMQMRMQKMLERAQTELQKRRAALVSEKQSNDAATKKAKAIPELQNKYESAKAEAQKLAQQRLIAQRSTAVLLAALEDESQYLTELQGICDIRSRLHDRVETNSFPALLQMVPKVQALMQKQKEQQKQQKQQEQRQKEEKEEKEQKEHVNAPVSTLSAAEVPKEPVVQEPAPKPVNKKASMRAHHKAPRTHKHSEATAAPQASTTLGDLVTAPKKSPVAPQSTPDASPQPKKPASPKATPASQQPAPVVSAKVPEKAPPMDEAPVDEAPAEAAPTNAPAAVAVPVKKAAPKRRVPQTTTAVPEESAAAPVPEDPVPSPQATPVDSEDSAPVPPKPVASTRFHAKKHPKAAKKVEKPHDKFMDSAYAAAAGDLPEAYGAWKPDDDLAAAPSKKADVNPENAVKAMTSAFGSDDASTEMPILSTPVQKKPKAAAAPAQTPTEASASDAATSPTPTDASVTDAAAPPPPATASVSDDQDVPAPPPRRKSHHHHRDTAAEDAAPPVTDEASAAPPPSPPAAPEESAAPPPSPPAVPMDDDDLPPKNFRAPQGLEGGWKSMMGKTKKRKHHKDLDQEIMDKIGSGTPSSYTAWKPDGPGDAAQPAADAAQPAAATPSQGANDADDGGPIGTAADEAALTGVAPPPPAPKKSVPPPAPQPQESEASTPVAAPSETPAPAETQSQAAPAATEAAPESPPQDADPSVAAEPAPASDPPAQGAPASSASLLQATTAGKKGGKKAAAKKSDAWADMMAGLSESETEMSKPAPKKQFSAGSAPAGSDASKMMALFAQPSAPAEPVLDAQTMANLPPPRTHHEYAPPGLEGGWQALMKKGKHKHHKYGDEMDLMQNQDLSAPPSTYAAWKPAGAAAAAKSAANNEFAAAMKDFDSDSFLQTGMEMGVESTVTRVLLAAASKQPAKKNAVNLLEKSSSTAIEAGESDERKSVASMVLDAYSDILASPPLHQLSLSRLDTPQLQNLWEKLQAVDPMTHPKAAAGQKAQAEQWCQYFEKNMKSAGGIMKQTKKWEQAESDAAAAATLHTAVMEEKQVREQLLGTLAQDRQVLTTLLQGEQHAFHDAAAQIQAWIQRADAELFSGMGADGLALHQAATDAVNILSNAQTEMVDVLELAIRKRGTVEANQKALLVQVTSEMEKVQSDWQEKKHHEDKAKKVLDKAAKKFAGVQKTCDKVLTGMEERRHGGHREMSAIRTALLVLSDNA